jgi:hypothetical protein
VKGLLEVVDEDPHGALAVAVSRVVDMNATPRPRATMLGALLSRLPEVEGLGELRGSSIYRLRSDYIGS